MELEKRIEQYTPVKYNPYFWWRRFKLRETKHHYTPLQVRIEHGDFEISDYHWWLMWERKLEQDALANEPRVEKQHELRGLYGERKRRLADDFEKDEAKIKAEMYKAFKMEFRIGEVELENKMMEFDGTLSEFYQALKIERLNKLAVPMG